MVQGVELELEHYGSRAPRRLFVIPGPMTLHNELHINGESCRSKIYCLNLALEILVPRQWGWGTKRIDQTKQDTIPLQKSKTNTEMHGSVGIPFKPQ